MIPHIVASLSAVYSVQTTINLYQEMKRNEMKYAEKKITESAEYAYLVCKYEENKNNLASQNSEYTGYVMPILSFVFENSIGILYHKTTTNTNTNTQYCKTAYDNKMSKVAIEYFDHKYSTPKFYINSKLSDKNIHKLIDSELKLIVAKNEDTSFRKKI